MQALACFSVYMAPCTSTTFTYGTTFTTFTSTFLPHTAFRTASAFRRTRHEPFVISSYACSRAMNVHSCLPRSFSFVSIDSLYNCSAQTHTSDTTEYNTHERHCGHYKRSVTLSGCARRGASRSHTIILVHAGSRAMSDTYLFNRTR